MSIRFDNRVAIVTGAGNGLGRTHALELAKRGAKVVVNDLGGARDGTGGSLSAADTVVEEIKAAGGEAMANGANVAKFEEVQDMVSQAVDKWGQVDILVNNAGILRDKTFAKCSLEDFRQVLEVHLMGSVHCSKAVWPIMQEKSYGRIVHTTSSSGLFGNFGQTNYGTAKLGVVGLMNSMKLEGKKYDIRVNCLAPTAGTRMTEDLMPKQVLDMLSPDSISPGLAYLVSEDAPQGVILSAAAGCFARAYIFESGGESLGRDASAEDVKEHWQGICQVEGLPADFEGGPSGFFRKAMTPS